MIRGYDTNPSQRVVRIHPFEQCVVVFRLPYKEDASSSCMLQRLNGAPSVICCDAHLLQDQPRLLRVVLVSVRKSRLRCAPAAAKPDARHPHPAASAAATAAALGPERPRQEPVRQADAGQHQQRRDQRQRPPQAHSRAERPPSAQAAHRITGSPRVHGPHTSPAWALPGPAEGAMPASAHRDAAARRDGLFLCSVSSSFQAARSLAGPCLGAPPCAAWPRRAGPARPDASGSCHSCQRPAATPLPAACRPLRVRVAGGKAGARAQTTQRVNGDCERRSETVAPRAACGSSGSAGHACRFRRQTATAEQPSRVCATGLTGQDETAHRQSTSSVSAAAREAAQLDLWASRPISHRHDIVGGLHFYRFQNLVVYS